MPIYDLIHTAIKIVFVDEILELIIGTDESPQRRTDTSGPRLFIYRSLWIFVVPIQHSLIYLFI